MEDAQAQARVSESGESYTVIRYAGRSLPDIYRNLVLSKWMRSFRYGNDYIKLADSDSYYFAYSIYINRILNLLPDTLVRLAVLTSDTDVVLGFSVIRGRILDFVHVHKDQRRQGIGRSLVPDYIERFTHLTRTGMKLWPTKMPKCKFDPFANLIEGNYEN
jgi:hypothetical protein